MTAGVAIPDPRPRLLVLPDGVRLAGSRCPSCDYRMAFETSRCEVCGSPTLDVLYGPAGCIWATTTLHIGVQGREVPYTLAYVDLDDGPRILTHVIAEAPPPQVGDRVYLSGRTVRGDPQVQKDR